MRARVLLLFCLGLNVLLVVMVVLLARDPALQIIPPATSILAKAPSRLVKTNVVVRRQPIAWSELESTDYRTYIANLRRAGCPEKTIRDIIVADVNDLFAERIAKEIVFPEQKWWLPEPDIDAFESGMSQLRALEAEKSHLLADLLGPDWAKMPSSVATIAGLDSRHGLYGDALRFDGPVLSKLSPEAKANVRQIEQHANQARDQVLAKAQEENRQPTATELSALQLETRRQLAGVLTGEQMEEYLLRYSPTADQMRDQLRGYGADADEFRRIFRLRDAYDQQLAALTGSDAPTQQRRAELLRVRDQSISQEIGPDRYGLYQMTQNPLFRQAQQQAEGSGAPPEKVLPLFRVNQAVQDEIARVQNDKTISDDQRRLALVTIEQQQKNSISRILANSPSEPPSAAPRVAVPGSTLPPLPPGVAPAQ